MRRKQRDVGEGLYEGGGGGSGYRFRFSFASGIFAFGDSCSNGDVLVLLAGFSTSSSDLHSTLLDGVAGNSKRIQPGGKDEWSRLFHSGFHCKANDKTPSDSTGTDIRRAVCFESGESIRLVPAGVHNPDTRSMWMPLTSGTAPLSSKNS